MKTLKNTIILALSLVFVAQPLIAEDEDKKKDFKDKMSEIYTAFRGLNALMASKEKFQDPANEENISAYITTIQTNFHKVDDLTKGHKNEPGFESNIRIIQDLLNDSSVRFKEGKKDYALWRLQTTANYCISCHTRFEVPVDFSGTDTDLSGLNEYEKGEFYFATRQFEEAKEAFLKAAADPELKLQHLPALRKWLVIYTRVHPDPQGAIKQLNKVRSNYKLNKSEDQEIQSWLASLRRWQNESNLKVTPLKKAQHLISQGITLNGSRVGSSGTVEMLRGSAILHKLLNDTPDVSSKERALVLYNLGLAYSNLPDYFANELPEMFYEQCIRDYPGTEEAKKSYQKYYDEVTVDYTGSAGTDLPPDVSEKLQTLKKLANSVVTPAK